MSQSYLLDTNAVLWMLEDSPKLGRHVRADLEDFNRTFFVSDIVFLEMAIKMRTGKLRRFSIHEIEDMLARNGMQTVTFDAWAAQVFFDLPATSWGDPFDRAHMALAEAKRLTLVTSDKNILQSGAVRCLDAGL
jgi:PIN domain nuclease of toxin-antitoxin system